MSTLTTAKAHLLTDVKNGAIIVLFFDTALGFSLHSQMTFACILA